MKVLIVNAGSSSLKYQLVDMDDESVIAKGQVERIIITAVRHNINAHSLAGIKGHNPHNALGINPFLFTLQYDLTVELACNLYQLSDRVFMFLFHI